MIIPREQFNELYHYGVKGMRWGVRRKRDVRKPFFPRGNDDYTGEGPTPEMKKAYGKGSESYISPAQATLRIKEEKKAEKKAKRQATLKKVLSTGWKVVSTLINPIALAVLPFRVISAGNKFIKNLFSENKETKAKSNSSNKKQPQPATISSLFKNGK